MRFRKNPLRYSIALVLTCLFFMLSCYVSPTAMAVVSIELSDLSYSDCPAEIGQGAVTSGGGVLKPANCFIITGTTKNDSGKPVVNADIFGRIYDANNNPVIQNRTRLGSIDQVPPGLGTFELRISVPEGLETPLHFRQFKASGLLARCLPRVPLTSGWVNAYSHISLWRSGSGTQVLHGRVQVHRAMYATSI